MEDIELYTLMNGEVPKALEKHLLKFKGKLNHLSAKDRKVVVEMVAESFLAGIKLAIDSSDELVN